MAFYCPHGVDIEVYIEGLGPSIRAWQNRCPHCETELLASLIVTAMAKSNPVLQPMETPHEALSKP